MGGEIILLPALPDEWSEGSIRGLRAKGGFGIDMEWSDGKLITASVTSDRGGECRLRINGVASIICGGETVRSRIEDGVIIFPTDAEKTYIVKT